MTVEQFFAGCELDFFQFQGEPYFIAYVTRRGAEHIQVSASP